MTGTLLDTHVLLWLLTDDPALGDEARRVILHGPAYYSAASAWELAIKSDLGKVTIPDRLAPELRAAGLAELPVTAEHALAIREVALPHRDPFDRLLVAAARAEGLTFLTADRVLLATELPGILDARE